MVAARRDERERCMARKGCRAGATTEQVLTCLRTHWSCCGRPMAVAYRTRRTITTLQGSYRLILRVRRCRNPTCERYHRGFRPEEEGKWALPHGEFGLDVIALVGSLRYTAHRSIPEVHQALRDRGVPIAERTVTYLLQRYEELVALHLADPARLHERFKEQGQVILALDGLQADVGHEVLWVVRDCLSGEVLLARSLLSACEADLANLLREVQQALDVPIRGVISDGQRSIRKAVQSVLPDIPHQLCHLHYLREAAKPVYEADRHAKKLRRQSFLDELLFEDRKIAFRRLTEATLHAPCLMAVIKFVPQGTPSREISGAKLYQT